LVEKKLAGKVALITGGARGIGKGYALRLAKLGADIAVIDRNLESFRVYEFERKQMTASTVMDECKTLGVNSMGLELDLTDRKATRNAVDQIVSKMGKLDIVICNAGGGTTKFADEVGVGAKDLVTTATPSNCPQDTLMRVLNNNLMTCIYTCMAVAPYMKKQKSGKIVTVAGTSPMEWPKQR
jgi:3-oxoacyl-[acyl-carrier protein] reductase